MPNTAVQVHWFRRIEWILLIATVVVAIVFRFTHFNEVPPGLHYDEAIDAHLAQEIRSGTWPVYFEEGWGREPLYHYLVAFTLNFVPDPASALRFVSGLLGLVQLVAAYLLFRNLFGVPTALIGTAWIAVMFWTVSTSRAGLRNISLTTLATLTALVFWWAWSKGGEARDKHRSSNSSLPSLVSNFIPRSAAFILSGILLGLTLYTYQPGRVVPLIYLMFVAYLFWRERPRVRSNWKSIIVFLSTAAIVAFPLIYFLATHPEAETGRAFQTEPLRAMLQGDFRPVIGTTMATLRMFTFEGGGDPQILYNITGRPLFIGFGSILFYIGLIICVIRWKQPQYAFILIWLIVTLLPNALTAPAPFFYRAIAAQTPALALPAIATVAISDLLNRRWHSVFSTPLQLMVVLLIAVVSLGQTAVMTWYDYFDVWGHDSHVRFQYSVAQTEIARWLDASIDVTPVVISGNFIEDSDPYIFDQTLHRRDLSIRWFDAQSALVAVSGATQQRLAMPTFMPLNDTLRSRFLPSSQPITQTKDFRIYSFDATAFRAMIEKWNKCLDCPVVFGDEIALLNIEQPTSISLANSTLTILTTWRILREGQPSSTKIFVHMLDANGDPTPQAQDDRLGYPRHTWQPGDEFVQALFIPLAKLTPGKYMLELGIYTWDDGRRWTALDKAGNVIGDHILLGTIEVTP